MITLLVIASLIGLVDSIYLAYKKTRPEPLVCPISGGAGCDAIVKSQYGKLLGLPNEYLGIIFYLINLALVLYTAVAGGASYQTLIRPLWLIMAAGAAIASVALTYIQGVIIKHWCEYCLVANVMNLIIFISLIYLKV